VRKVFITTINFIKLKGEIQVVSISVEVLCPRHGLERFRVRVFRKMNIPSNEIMPKIQTRPNAGEIACLYVGRNVSYEEAKKYLVRYLRENIEGQIMRIKMTS
jgi:hypothetical protein